MAGCVVGVRLLCVLVSGEVDLSFIPLHVGDNDACEAGGEGEDHSDPVARLDAPAGGSRGCSDDEDKQCGDGDKRDMEDRGQSNEQKVAYEE